ncbi:hypothetical protein [Cellulomonas endophytica]|uniref:hypothetical protein n=1 Tax=Cellulomonas endophytica TaxID=2494735 RepID=UPI001012F742|nr:hypothetical protein [Cellulomonas endophytica]
MIDAEAWRGARAHIQVSDPWDVYELFPDGRAAVRLIDRLPARGGDRPELLLALLEEPVLWSGREYLHLTVADRSDASITSTMTPGQLIAVTCRGLAEDVAAEWVRAHDAWRGGLTLVGSFGLD